MELWLTDSAHSSLSLRLLPCKQGQMFLFRYTVTFVVVHFIHIKPSKTIYPCHCRQYWRMSPATFCVAISTSSRGFRKPPRLATDADNKQDLLCRRLLETHLHNALTSILLHD